MMLTAAHSAEWAAALAELRAFAAEDMTGDATAAATNEKVVEVLKKRIVRTECIQEF